MRRKRLSGQGDAIDEGTVNLTPLIDVVFVVLIMFIIVAPMLEVDRVELANAASHENKEMAVTPDAGSINIHVREDNTIWFNTKLVSEDQLIAMLKEAKRQYPQRIPQLLHDKKAQFGTYQKVKNAVETSGFEQMDVILKPG